MTSKQSKTHNSKPASLTTIQKALNSTAKRRLSSEYTMFSILEYLCINAIKTPVSKYHVITKIPSIKQQRKDRVSDIMLTLENQGLITSIKTSESTFYHVTERE